jgi:hypothetical protein
MMIKMNPQTKPLPFVDGFSVTVAAVCLILFVTNILTAEDTLQSTVNLPKKAEGSRVLAAWTNIEGKTIEAFFQGLDGLDHVLLQLTTGVVHSYPIAKLKPESQHLARTGGVPKLITWTSKAGSSIEATFYGIDGPDDVLLRLKSGIIHRYPIAKLCNESQGLLQNYGMPLSPSVLVIGDSMSLGGFGKRLDQKFRALPGVDAATYMAGGTNPLSWLNVKPYTNAKTRGGYWRIKSKDGSDVPDQFMDIYDQKAGTKPTSRMVPKLERLLGTFLPQVLIVQSGNNLFSAFADGKTIRTDYHRAFIRSQIRPFVAFVANYPSSLRRVYWVTPPQAGCVTEEIQTFVFDEIRKNIEPFCKVIDSRAFTQFPYKMMGSDKEHFWGEEASQWADRVYDIVATDGGLDEELWTLPRIYETAKAKQFLNSEQGLASEDVIKLKATLVSITACPEVEKVAPYQELLVGYKYSVEEILEGAYAAKELLVMHPAYIGLKTQKIDSVIGTVYTLAVKKLTGASPWASVRRIEASASLDLDPHMLVEDESKHPDSHE